MFGSGAIGLIFRAFEQPIRDIEIARGWPDYSRGWYGLLILLGSIGVLLLAVGSVVAIVG